MKSILTILLLLLTLFASGSVPLDFFYQPGCQECAKVKALVLPPVLERFGEQVELHEYDIGILENYEKLVQFQEALQSTADEPVSMVVNASVLLAGYDEIAAKVMQTIEVALQAQAAAPSVEAVDWRKRADSFTFGAVALAGLIDGINPCVFATLVFFISLLSVAKISGRRLLLAGWVYCLACFLSYLALGFGLFHLLKAFSGYLWLRASLEWAMIALLGVMAFLSFRDAFRFHRTGRADAVTLQLPSAVKARIHAVMRQGLAYRYLLPGAFAIGVLVTALESVCTGQVYVPTLVLMTQTAGIGREFGLLLLYNGMFLLPLLVVFFLAYRGTKLQWFLAASKRNVVFAKCILGTFFILMIGLILIV